MSQVLGVPADKQQLPVDAVLTPLQQVCMRNDNRDLGEYLADLQAWLHDDLSALEASINDLHQHLARPSPHTNVAERAAAHLLACPGKRIRPICVLLGARLGEHACAEHVRLVAVASELVHAATLLHDDVIDEGEERRGAKSARVVFGNSASILAGDHLLIEALQRVRRCERSALLDGLLNVIAEMVSAEALQLERRGRFDANRNAYLHVIEGKTAALFSWALPAGGALGGLSNDAQASLARAGKALGLAFQLIDDVLDLEGSEVSTGKTVLADVREGKLTWPLIVAAERNGETLTCLQELAACKPQSESEALRRLGACIASTDALAATRAFAEEQAALARHELEATPDTPARRALEVVIAAAVHRQH